MHSSTALSNDSGRQVAGGWAQSQKEVRPCPVHKTGAVCVFRLTMGESSDSDTLNRFCRFRHLCEFQAHEERENAAKNV